jgi:hypothetical protein
MEGTLYTLLSWRSRKRAHMDTAASKARTVANGTNRFGIAEDSYQNPLAKPASMPRGLVSFGEEPDRKIEETASTLAN